MIIYSSHGLTVVFLTLTLNGMSWSAGKDFISRPYFGEQETDIVVQQGEVAFFNCHVHNLANQTVSWMRSLDGYPIYIGKEKYINDDRFELISNRIGDFTLRLKFTSATDAGKFECQVSTNPKISQVFSLKVVVPSVSVDGDTEKHVMSGSPVHLKCVIANCLKEPTYVFWYRSGSRLVEESGGRLRVRTGVQEGGRTAISILTIDEVNRGDDGEYTCKPASGGEAKVRLHVVRGEILPAMQHDQASAATIHYQEMSILIGFTALFCYL
ncbi:protein amalgam [Eurytemora carolleeae]|uniref:protein amalgam n=1 Tax=Eurytemora carolleeae TaxID=1294199 RepID=UPI000C7712B1|nr:protein amalgam [Eurytemora carolleeae]|eukprot:XP_023340316.1 protein amalgam-like [Eurytemora affinis]